MSLVRSRFNSSTELRLVTLLRQNKITGWRRGYKLTGKPDFTFPKQRLVIFTDGCFWHGHTCRGLEPKQNAKYWAAKISKNKKRDRAVARVLQQKGWTVVRIWECQLTRTHIEKTVLLIKASLMH